MKKTLLVLMLFTCSQVAAQQAVEMNPNSIQLPRYADLAAIQSAVPTPQTGMLVYNIGTSTNWQFNGNSWVNTAAALILPISQNLSSTTPLLDLTQNGTGQLLNLSHLGNRGIVANFETNNSENFFPTVQIYNQGLSDGLNVFSVNNGWAAQFKKPATMSGNGVVNITNEGVSSALQVLHSGTVGNTAFFSSSNATNTDPTINVNTQNNVNSLTVTNAGSNALSNAIEVTKTGNAGGIGFFSIQNTQNANNALEVTSNGTGSVIFGRSAGSLGSAGVFSTSNNNNLSPTISANTSGTGHALLVQTSNLLNTNSSLSASNNGQGSVGEFTVINTTNIAAVVRATTFGNGIGGFFQVSNQNNPSSAITATTNGTGSTLIINHTGSGTSTTTANNLARFQNNSINVSRIDKTGKGFFEGGTQNSGADLAEAFEVEGTKNSYEAGDVLAISTVSDRRVEKSSTPYSNLVAGVFATKPGVLLTEEHIDTNLDTHVPMGVVGVIPTKVCNEGGYISRGDFLVSSSLLGYAMKGDPNLVKPGQIIGKALENFGEKTGKIKVLVNIH